jgi:hypothetical protein
MFLAVRWASSPVFMFCAPDHIFSGSEGVGSRFHVLRAQTRFLRYQGHRVSFSCFAIQGTFTGVRRASDPVLMFSALRLIFGGTEGVGTHFHVLRARTLFRLYGWCRVPFSCFVCPDSFSAVSRASGLVFMFLRSRARFRRYGGPPVLFSCFARTDSFSAVPWSSGPVFMFFAPEHVFGD